LEVDEDSDEERLLIEAAERPQKQIDGAYWDGELDAYAEQLSKTPAQFVYPNIFWCLHKLKCCRARKFDFPEAAILPLQEKAKINKQKIKDFIYEK
jgi:hypothetical protein